MGVVLYAPSLALNAGEKSQLLAASPSSLGKHFWEGQVEESVQKRIHLGLGIVLQHGPLAGLASHHLKANQTLPCPI